MVRCCFFPLPTDQYDVEWSSHLRTRQDENGDEIAGQTGQGDAEEQDDADDKVEEGQIQLLFHSRRRSGRRRNDGIVGRCNGRGERLPVNAAVDAARHRIASNKRDVSAWIIGNSNNYFSLPRLVWFFFFLKTRRNYFDISSRDRSTWPSLYSFPLIINVKIRFPALIQGRRIPKTRTILILPETNFDVMRVPLPTTNMIESRKLLAPPSPTGLIFFHAQ